MPGQVIKTAFPGIPDQNLSASLSIQGSLFSPQNERGPIMFSANWHKNNKQFNLIDDGFLILFFLKFDGIKNSQALPTP